MTTAINQQRVTPDQALTVANLDALSDYRDLSPFRIEIELVDEGWKIDYVLKSLTMKGGGPHYIVDAETGAIVSKRYEQ